MIEFSVVIYSQPNQQDALLNALLTLVKSSREEVGAVMYDLHACEEGVFVITEKWQSQDALDAHEATEHFVGFQEKAGKLVEKVRRLPLVSI